MSSEAIASPVTLDAQGDCDGDGHKIEASKPTGLHSPPDSNNAMVDGSDSELSELDDMEAEQMEPTVVSRPEPETKPEPKPDPDEDIGEVLPDHYSGTVPVFRPTMKQFKDFKLFMGKIDSYGMKSGIVKIIPPVEWKEAQPRLDDLVKQIRVRDPIKQEIMGSNGTYRQVNLLHQRAYNLPQWRQLCDQSEHQPPARRGERRANADKPRPKPAARSRAAAASSATKSAASKSKKGRVTRRSAQVQEDTAELEDRPMTPVSPKPEDEEVIASVERDPGVKEEGVEDDTPVIRRMGGIAKPKTQSTSARRKYIRREGSAMIDEAAFKDFDYLMDVSDYTPERCEELERTYWRTLTYAPPLYGADLPGTLFDESNEIWNLNKLPNLLDVLGTKVPGVNTAYLYLGMWKATFAWHLEDVDLYSINYLHFGAPKQWYSISQGDARRFEAAMKNIWPTDAKSCDQFLRHKGFLISPAHLKQHYNITVNKCVSYPGEFVVTYPYGYHSGYNLGYNCAEAVNFALDSWLPMGKIAKRCQCAQAQDSVWVDVYEIERKLRGESTEYEMTEDEEDEEEEDDDDDTGLPTPPSSHAVRVKAPSRKRKRVPGDKDGKKVKKIRIRPRTRAEPPCCLCPNDIPGAEILSTDDGRKAHRMCALYVPETYIETVDGKEIVANANGINKARLELKCLYCRSKKGACFQCSQKKCARSYHATCAAAAGVFVEEADVPVFGEDGTEYKEQAFEFSCRFHRAKRDKKHDGDVLENNARVCEASGALKKGDICQMQFYRGDIFAGVVVENRHDEQNLLLDIIPGGDRIEVEWKWLLLPDPSEYRLPKASANAIPMPTTRKAKEELNARRPVDELPRKDDSFVEGFTWAEFQAGDATRNPTQVKVNLARDDQIWHYLGKTSTESKAQYTENAARQQHNPKSSFLDSIPRPVAPVSMAPPPQPRRSHSATHISQLSTPIAQGPKSEKPYVYKPRKSVELARDKLPFATQRFMPQLPAGSPLQYRPGHLPQEYQQLPRQQHPAGTKHPPPAAADPRFKDHPPSASFTLDRFAPVGGSNGFPQLPGLTSPPAHMKSGPHSQPPPRAWSSSTSSAHATPMTASLLKSPGPARPVSTYQKYNFFQVHHNRDSTRYRSPYATWGGFTNGYEGNFRAFMMKAQQSLSGNGSGTRVPASLQPWASPKRLARGPYGSLHASSSPQTFSTVGPGPLQVAPDALNRTSAAPGLTMEQTGAHLLTPVKPTGGDGVEHSHSAPLHPAIRPQYGATWQQGYASAQRGVGQRQVWEGFSREDQTRLPSTPMSVQPQAPLRTPSSTKQSHSPIPLPPYVQQKSSATHGARSTVPLPTASYAQGSPAGMAHSIEKSGNPAGQNLATPASSVPSPLHQDGWSPTGAYSGSGDRRVTIASPASTISPTSINPAHQQRLYPADALAAPRASGCSNGRPPLPSAGAGELPDVPADSTALLEQMMANLRRASERDAVVSQGVSG